MLTRIFLWLFWACRHRWKIIRDNELRIVDSKVVGHRYVQQCEKCGMLKQVDVL